MRKIQEVPSLNDIRTIHNVGASSAPKDRKSCYLELSILAREQDRLKKEIKSLEKRKNNKHKQLHHINKRIEKLHSEAQEEQKVNTDGDCPMNPRKTMSINY